MGTNVLDRTGVYFRYGNRYITIGGPETIQTFAGIQGQHTFIGPRLDIKSDKDIADIIKIKWDKTIDTKEKLNEIPELSELIHAICDFFRSYSVDNGNDNLLFINNKLREHRKFLDGVSNKDIKYNLLVDMYGNVDTAYHRKECYCGWQVKEHHQVKVNNCAMCGAYVG